ncbi:hypothetical protein ACHFJ0_09570 [Paracoccus sp. NGMCC 1.201697]|uniref:PepSY domain-containing protein n=1 Tax=Paracoccus broussonetiae subsp. drimophilus TaxID=3373869 RepID=A0ABW7LJJ5_9RHOB
MSRYFTSSVAAAALMSLLAGPVLAQTAPQQPEAAEAGAQAQAQVVLPEALRDVGLTDLTSKSSRHGSRVSGKLPDGTEIGIMLDEQGGLRGIRSRDDAPLPSALVERLVPQAVRGQQIFGELGQIEAIFLGDRGVMLAGQDAKSKSVRAAFAEDGTLMRFGRGDDEGHGPGIGPDGDRHHRRHDGDRDGRGRDDDRGHWRRDGGRDHGDHDRGDRDHKGPRHEGRMGPGDGPDGMNPPAGGDPLTPDAIRSTLTEAGYTELGQILQQGRVTVAQATNPEGEPVLVEIAPNGRVVRELNR